MGQAVEASLQTTTSSSQATAQTNRPALPTFMDHVHELRGRLFWIAVIFILASIAAYPFIDPIISFLVAPLKGQELYYLTPIAGFSFMIKISTYVGAIVTMPAIIYHLYRYLQPAVGQIQKRLVLSYVFFSSLLAIAGVAFAYYVSLPAALYFLTGLNIASVTAMLTIDSYYSFIMTYMIGCAVLFQLPLVLLIINTITPLKPRKLMGYQRHVILGAFIAAAIISPTPDMTNQALLAVPVIVMYQIGIILIWLRNKTKRSARSEKQAQAFSANQSQRQIPKQAPQALLAASEDRYAWIDELLQEEKTVQVVEQATPTPAQAPLSVTSPTQSISQPPKDNEQLAQAAVTRVPIVPRVDTVVSRGYAMDFSSVQRSRMRDIARPLPTIVRMNQKPANGATSFAASVKKAVPTKSTIQVRYVDGVSAPIQNAA